MRRLFIAGLLVFIGGCTATLDRPPVGDTWQIDGIDQSGVFGTITVERGEIIRLPPGANADAFAPGADRGILVRVSYEPDRPSDAGFGSLDWEGDVTGPGGPRIMGLAQGIDWPVNGTLPNQLPGSANSISGWLIIPVTEAELDQPVNLLYQPMLADEPESVAEIVIHAP